MPDRTEGNCGPEFGAYGCAAAQAKRYVLKRKGIVAMNSSQIILVLVFCVAFILILFAKQRFPEKVNKLIPYNFVLLGSLFCYLSKANNNVNKFSLLAGVAFFVYGIFLLFKRSQLHKENRK
jgi:hypothetical protein